MVLANFIENILHQRVSEYRYFYDLVDKGGGD
jgi:hypothetical protein